MRSPNPLTARLRLMVITDSAVGPGRSLVGVVQAVLRGGAPAIQLRAKTHSAREMVELAAVLAPVIRATDALFIVNDRVDVALAVGADGAHLGDDDLPLAAARRIVPPTFILGRSVETPEQAKLAEAQAADYLGVGPVYPTESKADAGRPVSPDRVAAVAASVQIPVVGIGGIDIRGARAVAEAGAAGVAVIRAAMQADDPEAAARALLQEVAAGRAEY
jgi:thiamine-phosphate pyrophosphorylase